jgi:imidazolonepropionase-like amidohydrolase
MPEITLRGALFDGFHYYERGIVVIDSDAGMIKEAGPVGSASVPPGSKLVEVPNSTILPGLIDAHVHFIGTNNYDALEAASTPLPIVVLRSLKNLRDLLQAGFTSVRDLGTKGGNYLSQAEKEGIIVSPRIVSCARFISQTGGGDDIAFLPRRVSQALSDYCYFCDDPWQCQHVVRKIIRDGAEVVKVYASTDYPRCGKVRIQLTVDELKVIVAEAHKAGIRVAAHASGREAIENVLEAGVDSIEHGMGLTEELASSIKKSGAYYVPTLIGYLPMIEGKTPWTPDEEGRAFIKEHLTTDMKLAKRFGLPVVVGSDRVGATVAPHGTNYKEIVEISKHLGNEEAMISATSRAAQCLGLENTGILGRGYLADVITVKGNPLKQIEALAPSNVTNVFRKGVKIK